jgi:hypothetical protein
MQFKSSAVYLIYKDESLLFVCLFVPYTESHFFTNLNHTLHTSPPWSGRDRRVCIVRKCLILFYLFDLLHRERVQNPEHKMTPGARHFRDSVISVILARVSYGNDVFADDTCPDSSATALYPWFLQVFVWRHGNDVVADDTCTESSATALYPWFLQVLVWRHGNEVVSGDTCAFLLEVSCTMGNAYKTPWSERNTCVKTETLWDRKHVNKELQLQLLQ